MHAAHKTTPSTTSLYGTGPWLGATALGLLFLQNNFAKHDYMGAWNGFSDGLGSIFIYGKHLTPSFVAYE